MKSVNKQLILLGALALVAGNLQLPAAFAAEPGNSPLSTVRQSLVDLPSSSAESAPGGVAIEPEGAHRPTAESTSDPAKLDSTPPGAGARADDGADTPVLTVNIDQVTPSTQSSMKTFEYVVEFSCISRLAACADVVITLPLHQTTALASGAAPMSEWAATLIPTDLNLIEQQEEWQTGQQTRTVELLTDLAAGHSGSFRLQLKPSAGMVANGTAWELLPSIAASNAAGVVAPTAATSSATASSRHTSHLAVNGRSQFPQDVGVGTTFGITFDSHFLEHDGEFLRPDQTKPDTASVVLPPEVDFVEHIGRCPDQTYDPATRTLTCEKAAADHLWPAARLVLKEDIPLGTIIELSAYGIATRIGETAPSELRQTGTIRASRDHVDTEILLGLFRGNGMIEGAGFGIVPSSETPEPTELFVRVMPQRLPTIVTTVTQMPCLTPRVSGQLAGWYPSDGCTAPVVTVRNLKIVTRNMDYLGPIPVTVVLGSGEEFSLTVGQEPVSLAQWAEQVVEIRMEGLELESSENSGAGGGVPFPHLELVAEVDMREDTEVIPLERVVFYHTGEVQAASDPSNAGSVMGSSSLIYRKGELGAAIMNYSDEIIDGWTWGDRDVMLRASAGFIAPRGDKNDSGSVAVLLPRGLRPDPTGNPGAEVIEDFRGTGRTLVRVLRGGWGDESLGGIVDVDTRSLDPGLYTYDIYHGFVGYSANSCEPSDWHLPVAPGQRLESGIEDIFVAGEAAVACHATLPLLVKGAQTGHSVVKSVRGDGDAEWVGAPGTTAVGQDGTGSAEYRLQWANTGPTAIHGLAVYDVLPAPGDAGSVGALAGLPRGSDYAVTYENVTTAAGFTTAYSVSDNPCRPELGGEDASCVDDWSTTPPASLADVRALRFTPDAPMTAGAQAEFLIEVGVPAIAEGEVAVNTVAAGGALENGRPIPAVESAYVGVGAELRDADIVVSKSADVPETQAVKAGDQVTYTIEVRNDGGVPGEVKFDDLITGVMDDATLVTAPTVTGSESVTATAFDGVIELRGALAAGEAATISYTVEVSAAEARGDHSLRNFVVTAGGSAGDACLPEDATCTQHAVSDLVLRKSADPESGTVLAPGAAVTYALEVENLGGETELALTDMLAGVLDDAELVGELTVSPDTVTAAVVGDELVLSGTLAAGASATVTYGVRAKDAAIGGDAMLRNWFVAAGSALPEKCVADAVNCTVHPVDVGGATKPPATIDPPVTVTPPGGGSSGGLSATGRSSGAGPVWAAGALVLLLGAAMWRGGRLRSGAMSAVARR